MSTLSKSNLTKAIYLLTFIVPTLFLFQSSQLKKDGKDLKLGKKAPLSSLKMDATDGGQYSLDDINSTNGFIVLFSCNTCPFVVGSDSFDGWELQYNEIHQKAEELNMGLILINSNEAKREGVDSMEEMKSHSENKEYTMPYVVDIDSKMADAFGAKTTPHAFIFNSDKKLVYKGSIDNSWDSKRSQLESYLYDAIQSLSEGKEITTASTAPRGCSIKRNK